jgi:hypothetical protein
MDDIESGKFLTEPPKWAAIVGLWSFKGEKAVTYLGPQEGQPTEHDYGLCVSNTPFSEGEAKVIIRLPMASAPSARTPKAILGRDGGTVAEDTSAYFLLGYRSPTEEYFGVGLAGYNSAYTITHFDPAYGWRPVAMAGSKDNLLPGHPYEVTTRLLGQKVILEVDGVRVLERVLDRPLPDTRLGLFAWGKLPVQFTNISVSSERPTAFVVIAFSSPYLELYADVIKPIAEEPRFNLRPYNVGDVFGPGVILNDVVRGIAEAKVVIAEITPPNQNVFYELGYAHALNKPTILLAESGKDLPFDIRGYRCIFYENSIAGKNKVQTALRRHLAAILNE